MMKQKKQRMQRKQKKPTMPSAALRGCGKKTRRPKKPLSVLKNRP